MMLSTGDADAGDHLVGEVVGRVARDHQERRTEALEAARVVGHHRAGVLGGGPEDERGRVRDGRVIA
ncbi:MAG TPA: hypothetical protein VIK12_02615, partial [Pengzhenrongella sp.]